jgi:hypothetical protein
MMATVDEQSRLKARIADFELRIAEARENDTGAETRLIGNAERDQMMQMLVRTLKALKARQATLRDC